MRRQKIYNDSDHAVLYWSAGSAQDRLDMAHEKLLRLLQLAWLVVVFPAGAAILVWFLSHSTSLGIKAFLLIESGVAILSPLLTAIWGGPDNSHRNRGK
jgi:hypothetical protein